MRYAGNCQAIRYARLIGNMPRTRRPGNNQKQGPNQPTAGSRDISWTPPGKLAAPGIACRKKGPRDARCALWAERATVVAVERHARSVALTIADLAVGETGGH